MVPNPDSDRCKSGKPCGSSCISRTKKCRVSLSDENSKSLSQASGKLRRAQGQSLEGSDLDYPKLKERARKWAKENGLGDPDDVLPGHDETHVLVRDYLGKTSQALGALMGERSGGGPTNFEEVLVEAFENLSRNPKADTGKLFPESIRETFSLSKNLGVLPDNHLYNRDPQRATSVSVRYLEEITKRPDFTQFLLTVKTARRKAREDS